ncbi:MAG: sigma-E factor negative regulatory protein [Burkholderiales bacterium]
MSDEISALMDSELAQEDLQRILTQLRQRPELGQRWLVYHMIGDTLRDTVTPHSPRFISGFSQRLASEPTILAPRRTPKFIRPALLVSAAASLSAVAVAAWIALQPGTDNETIPTMVQRAPDLAAYMIAHQEFTPGPASQGGFSNLRPANLVQENP